MRVYAQAKQKRTINKVLIFIHEFNGCEIHHHSLRH